MMNKHKSMLNLINNKGNVNWETHEIGKRGPDNSKWWTNVHWQTEISYTDDGSANSEAFGKHTGVIL